MDTVAERKIQGLSRTADKVRATELIPLLEKYAGTIQVLSLDCFDTLLWRKVALPFDVFFDLQHKPMFQSIGLSASLRCNSEVRARQKTKLNQQNNEVRLEDIYRASYPAITQAQIDQLIEEEMSAELDACYAFPPMLELIRVAHRLGLKIVIVSDTYFTEHQLRRLLTNAFPSDVLAMINKIFCSNEQGRGKADGLFQHVIKTLGCKAERILHVGDNLAADYLAPRQLQLNSVLFVHHDDCVADLLELQTAAANILDPLTRTVRSMSSPFRGVLAAMPIAATNPESLIGYASLGPLMYAFAQFILEEVAQLKQMGKKPKVIFLMRDAYLPSLICETIAGHAIGKRVRISRFASYAASFRKPEDVDHYLIDAGQTNRLRDLARQLLLPDSLTESLIQTIQNNADPVADFLHLIHRKDVMKITLEKSAEYRARLLRHLENEVGLESGDTLVLVDLGYSGTAQRRLTPVFEDIGVEVRGCYLLSLNVPGWKANRSGLLDPSWCEDNAMLTIVFYITILEQLCTSNEKSVIDYDKEGHPIYSDITMSGEQHGKLVRIQAECVRFAQDAKKFFQAANMSISRDKLQKFALAELGRMIFFSTLPELQYLKTFEGETNLGTADVFRVFDVEKGLTGLRRRGMFYMEKPSKKTRTNYPAELRMAGMEFVLALIAQQRFNLDIKLKNMILRSESLPILFVQGQENFQTAVDALATSDGYFAAWLPGGLQVSLLLGKNYQWVQIESAELIKKEDFIAQCETQNTEDLMPLLIFNHMIDRGGNLYECLSPESHVTMKPTRSFNPADYLFRFVFRPTVKQNLK